MPAPNRPACAVGTAAAALLLGFVSGTAVADDPPAERSPTTIGAEELVPGDADASADAVTVNGEPLWRAVWPDEVAAAQTARAAAATSALAAHRFYVSQANYAGSQALTACASGFHMASMWEIIDPSNLTYAFDHPAAKVFTDSGMGPPSNWFGWVRTGGGGSGADTPGTGNCYGWTSASGSDYGTVVRLAPSWASSPALGGCWQAIAWYCSGMAPIWCVED